MLAKTSLIIDVSKLGGLKTDLADAAILVEGYNEDIFNDVKALGEGWSGASYDAFVAEFERHRKYLETVAHMFNVYSSKVGEYNKEGETMLSNVIAALGNVKAVDAKNFLNLLEKTSYADEYYLAYGFEIGDNTTAKQIRKQAENIELNLYADIELLNQELRSIEINKKALEKNKELLGDDKQYDLLMKALEAQQALVEKTMKKYTEAYNALAAELENKIWPFSEDGGFVEASDGIFENDREKAISTANMITDILTDLPPVSTVVETSAVNGLLAYGKDDYLANNFVNGSSVSDTMMQASISIAQNTGDFKNDVTADGKEVVLFNSRGIINSGLYDDDSNPLYAFESLNYTFSQDDAYGDYYGDGSCVFDGYDSICIKGENGEDDQYLTYAQYVRIYGELR